MLNINLRNLNLAGLALRTRSRIIKEKICEALDYEIPKSFKKTKPKFPCQNLDVYTQKSNNLQIWNDEIDPVRRYAIIKIDENDIVTKIKIVTGSELEVLDTTGTLTSKYQARVVTLNENIVSEESADLIYTENPNAINNIRLYDANSNPNNHSYLSNTTLFNSLRPLIGRVLSNNNIVQERTRADEAHKLACSVLGYMNASDDGAFPDIKNQLLEVKLQMSPTIDLGLHRPDSDTEIGIEFNGVNVKCSDVRYLIMLATRRPDNTFVIDNIQLVTGNYFFNFYTLFGGKVQNTKIQIPLPSSFFD